jgi:rare lipoprotein A
MTAAHKTLPLPTWVRVRNISNGKTVVVKVNDRGPFKDDRIIDLSYAAARKLGVVGPGTANVEIRALSSTSASASETPVVRAVPLPSPPVEEGDVFIQLGSFGSESNAQKFRQELNNNHEKPIVVSRVETDQGTFYRVRLGPLLDVREANSVHKRLRRKGYENARIVIGEE